MFYIRKPLLFNIFWAQFPASGEKNAGKQRCGLFMEKNGKANTTLSNLSKGFKHSSEDEWLAVLNAEFTCLCSAREKLILIFQ